MKQINVQVFLVTEVSASDVPAVLNKFVLKEATSEVATLKLYLAARLCLCDVILSDLKVEWRGLNLHLSCIKIFFLQVIIHFTIVNVIIPESGTCLAQNNTNGSRAAITQS